MSRLHQSRGQASLRLRNYCRNFIPMTCHCPDPSGASEWSCRVGNFVQPIRSTTQVLVVMRHQHGISAFVPDMSFRGETLAVVASRKAGCFHRVSGVSLIILLQV